MRAAACAARLLAAPAALISVPAAAQQRAPSGYEEGIFELIATGLPPATLNVLVSPRGKYLLPLRATLEPLGVPFEINLDSSLARAVRPGGSGSATIRWSAARTLEVTVTTPLDSDDVVVRGAEVYVAAPRLAELVEASLDVDLATLTVRAHRAAEFPAQIRLDVHDRRRAELRRSLTAEALARPVDVPFIPTTGFGVLEWAFGGGIAPLSTPTSVESRIGMGLYGGMLKTRQVFELPTATTRFGAVGTEASYHRVFPRARLVSQVQIGDIFSAGALARPMRGVSVTNAPFVREQRFGDLPFSRPLPPGWEYEVYEGDRLVGYADAATNSPLNIPLRYGTTPLRVRLYGPAGELVESAVSYVIPVDQLPGGEWLYSAGLGRCALGQCDELGYADLRHGVTRWLTLQGGVDELRDTTTRVVHPYGAVSLLPAPGWTAALQARKDAYVRGAVQHFGDGRVTGGASAGLNSPGEGGIAISRETDKVWFLQTALQLLHIVPRLGERSLTLVSRVEGRQHGGGGRWDVAATVPIDRGLLEVGLQSDPLAGVRTGGGSTPLLRIAPTVSFTQGRMRRLGSPIVRVEAGLQGSALVQWDIGISLQPGRGFANIAVRHLVGIPGTQLAIGASMSTGPARLLARIAGRGGKVEGGYSATGALAFGPLSKLSTLEYGGLGLAGVEGRVFRDRDGDGRYSPTDEAIAGITVQVGALRTVTDSLGRYAVWNAVPYEPIEVQLDSLSLDDPSWVPTFATRALRPSPQQYTRIDFPLVHTREVIGRIESVGALGPPAGVGVALRDATTGALYETRTFSDGAFYLSRVRPGRYAVSVGEPSLRALGARLTSAPEVVVRRDGDEAVEMAPIKLVAAPRGGAP